MNRWIKRLGALSYCLDAVVFMFAMGECLRGSKHPLDWTALAFALPATRAIVHVVRRQETLPNLWASLDGATAPGWRLPWRTTFALIVLPCALLYLSTQRTLGSGDTWPAMASACSLVTQGDCELGDYVADVSAAFAPIGTSHVPYFVQETPYGLYSAYPSGMVPFAVATALLSRTVGGDLRSAEVYRCLEKWTATWLAAASMGLFFLIALHLGSPTGAYATTLLLAAGSAMFSTASHGLWQQGGVVFWSLACLLVDFRCHRTPRIRGTMLQGVFCAQMAACRLSSALFIGPFVIWTLARSPKRAALLTCTAAAAFIPWAYFYWSTYGTFLGPSSAQLERVNWTSQLTESLLGVLVSPSRGLFIYQPWFVLALLPGLPAFRCSRGVNCSPSNLMGWLPFCSAAVVLQIVLVASWWCWWGGHCWGSRLLTEPIAIGALLCVGPVSALWNKKWGRVVIAALFVWSTFIQGAGVYRDVYWESRFHLDDNPELLWSWSKAPFFVPGF